MYFIKNDIWNQIVKAKKYIDILDTCTNGKKPEYKEILKAFEIAEEQHKKENKRISAYLSKKRKENKNFARGVKTYSYKKNKARFLAQNWQSLLDSPIQHSWDWCAKWQNIFERIAKKYGLQKEFKENGIL